MKSGKRIRRHRHVQVSMATGCGERLLDNLCRSSLLSLSVTMATINVLGIHVSANALWDRET